MGALLALGAVATAGAVVVGLFGVVWFVLKLVLLPIRLAFGLVKLVMGVVFGALGMLAMLALAPVLVVAVGGAIAVGLVIALLAALLPLVPFILLGLVVWSFLKRPAVAA
jgi:hypothetical protein